MKYYFAVFGYEITQKLELEEFVLHPVANDLYTAKQKSKDENNFNLTAIGQVKNSPCRDTLFDLEGTLTFCQQQAVIVSDFHQENSNNNIEKIKKYFPNKINVLCKRYTSGALVRSDDEDSDGRIYLINLCLRRLKNSNFNAQTDFRVAFFRNVESWKLRSELIDVTYYIDFSALEILSRKYLNDFKSKDVANLICRFLNCYCFDVKNNCGDNRKIRMDSYAHLRNALFHNGKFEKTFDDNGAQVTLNLSEYSENLRRLVPDVLLKVIGYQNSSINWNRWVDRMHFC